MAGYAQLRNDPNKNALSGLSPYLHFGMISSLQVVKAVRLSNAPAEDQEAFLEELVVRKELSDNFAFYSSGNLGIALAPDWAKRTISKHRGDIRPVVYSLEQLVGCQTHDRAWNAAQKQLMLTGKMHGYMRMYWAKKSLGVVAFGR